MTTARRRLRARAWLPNLVEAYLHACRVEGKSSNTLPWYEQKPRGFTDFLRSRRLPLDPSGLTPEIQPGT